MIQFSVRFVILAVCCHSIALTYSTSYLRLSLLQQNPLVLGEACMICLTQKVNACVGRFEARQAFQLKLCLQLKPERVFLTVDQQNAFSNSHRQTFSDFAPANEAFL